MTETAHGDPVPLDLSPEEAWVVHAAVLAALERAVEDDDAWCTVGLLETVEGDRAFTPDELRSLRKVLQTYFTDAPDRDRETTVSVLDTVDAALA
jgi:hypothetical protein